MQKEGVSGSTIDRWLNPKMSLAGVMRVMSAMVLFCIGVGSLNAGIPKEVEKRFSDYFGVAELGPVWQIFENSSICDGYRVFYGQAKSTKKGRRRSQVIGVIKDGDPNVRVIECGSEALAKLGFFFNGKPSGKFVFDDRAAEELASLLLMAEAGSAESVIFDFDRGKRRFFDLDGKLQTQVEVRAPRWIRIEGQLILEFYSSDSELNVRRKSVRVQLDEEDVFLDFSSDVIGRWHEE